MKDIDICKRFNIPYRTLAEWKTKDKDNWRYKLYWFMQNKLTEEKINYENKVKT